LVVVIYTGKSDQRTIGNSLGFDYIFNEISALPDSGDLAWLGNEGGLSHCVAAFSELASRFT
jgi:hypothetical protein